MRWKLRSKHYLNILSLDGVPVEWEQTLIGQNGRNIRKRYPVPLLLDPEDPAYQNYDGEIVVCMEGKGYSRDYVLVGDPTPEMEPLDDEARALSASLEPKWKAPMGDGAFPGIGSGGFNDQLLVQLNRQLETLINQNGLPKAAENPVGNVAIDAQQFAELQAVVQKQQEMIERLMAGKEALELDTDTTPLPPAEPTPAPARRSV